MNEHSNIENAGIKVSVFKNGRSRAVRIPKEFELAGENVIMNLQPDGSILIRTAETSGLVDYLKTAEAWTGDAFIGDDGDLEPLDEIDLP
ncbi:antitoxin [Pararhizobium qamdonense]|uniref:antitoxin n=1 Tax=Pararhizobium qamdonense TaxID=3031126 RepID=UPI0023E2C8A8|nr:AbrB/MazE/SpoVT family DNA-binding domain-containing protein [Pararhizobium qamdonense]